MVGLLVPKPDLIFVLENPAGDIFARKPELTIAEIRHQQDVIRGLLAGRSEARIIDATVGISGTVDAVAREIEVWLVERGG
jgi:hypothetical protein